MTQEHDEALVERVALSMLNAYRQGKELRTYSDFAECDVFPDEVRKRWCGTARAAIYPPKTKLEVARGLLEVAYRSAGWTGSARAIAACEADDEPVTKAVLAALSMPAMED